MTAKPLDKLREDIRTFLPDNSSRQITPSRLRARLEDIADSAVTAFAPHLFGAVGDGAANNADAFMAMRAWMLDRPGQHHIIDFHPGTYLYDNNRWLAGVRKVTINGNGARFQNVQSASARSRDRYPLYTGDIFSDPPPIDGLLDIQTGYRFASASAGAWSITMSTPGDEAHFTSGERVFLHWCDQQFSNYPPNARFFEWNEVAAVGDGVIELKQTLIHDYSEAWKDTDSFGKPRVKSLDRSGYTYPSHVEIRDVEFLNNPASPLPTSNGLFIPAERLVLRNVKHNGYFWPQQSRWSVVEDCDLAGVEFDKLADRVEIRRSTIRSTLDQATGVNTVVLEDNDIHGRVYVCPRRLFARRNRLVLPAGWEYGAFIHKQANYVEHFEATDNVVISDGSLLHMVNDIPDDQLTVTIAEVGQGGEMYFADDAAGRSLMKRVQIGAPYWCDAGKGRVTAQYFDGTKWVLEGTKLVVEGESVLFGNCGLYVIANNKAVGVGAIPAIRIGRDLT